MILVEALFLGLITVVVGLLISYCTMYVVNPETVKDFDHWKSVIISFFITGFLIHLLCEYSGINKWYCKYGNACTNQLNILVQVNIKINNKNKPKLIMISIIIQP